MSKFGVIILNYIGWEDTMNCIDSFIRNANGIDLHIVVVDNGSPNESMQELKTRCSTINCVEIVALAQNEGFAKGNNYGYEVAKKYNCDYYIFSNSDIVVQSNLFPWISQIDKENGFDILGPDIYAIRMDVHQNPLAQYTENINRIRINIIKREIAILLLRIGISVDRQNIRKKVFSSNTIDKVNEKMIGVTAHGSFIIFNKSFFSHYNVPFDDRTFLYMEEHILFQRCKKAGLKSLVSLDQQVIHLQGASTERIDKNAKYRKIWKLQNEIDSIKVYKDIIIKNKQKAQ